MKKIFITIVASILLSSSVFAASFNIGATGAIATVEADGKETTGAGASGTANVNKKQVDNENVAIGSVFAEYESDYWGITLGVEYVPGEADVSNSVLKRTDTETSVTGGAAVTSTSRTFQAQATVENLYTAYIELPIYESFFVRAGMASIDVNTEEVKSGNGGSYGNKTLDGTTLGAGFKGNFEANDQINWKIYYEATDFDTLKLTSSGNSVASETNSIEADLDVSALKLAIGYRF